MAIERLPSERGTWNGKTSYPEIFPTTRVVHPHTGQMMTGAAFLAEVSQAKERYGRWPEPQPQVENVPLETSVTVGETAVRSSGDIH